MKITGAWHIDELPNHIIVENKRGFHKFLITPFRQISYRDLLPYEGHHPETRAHELVPHFILDLYGLKIVHEEIYLTFEMVGKDLYANLGAGDFAAALAEVLQSRYKGHTILHYEEYLYFNEEFTKDDYRAKIDEITG